MWLELSLSTLPARASREEGLNEFPHSSGAITKRLDLLEEGVHLLLICQIDGDAPAGQDDRPITEWSKARSLAVDFVLSLAEICFLDFVDALHGVVISVGVVSYVGENSFSESLIKLFLREFSGVL